MSMITVPIFILKLLLHRQICHLRGQLYFFLPPFTPFIYFYCPVSLAKTSSRCCIGAAVGDILAYCHS